MGYKQQLIIQFLDGTKDATITTGSDDLKQKALHGSVTLCEIVTCSADGLAATDSIGTTARAAALDAIKKFDKGLPTRLYINGHGYYGPQIVGGRKPAAIAALIAALDFPFSVVSVTACSGGRDKGTSGSVRLAAKADSFGSELHRLLKSPHGIVVPVYARVADVAIGDTGTKSPSPDDYVDASAFKLRFWWENGEQKREYVPIKAKAPVTYDSDDDGYDGLATATKQRTGQLS